MTIADLMREAESGFTKAIERLKQDLAGLQTGRASGALVEHLHVEAYGIRQPLKALANVSVPDGRTIAIQPWDRSTLSSIEKAIRDSELGLNPNNDGIRIILNIPMLTEERRRDLVKVVGQMAEEGRISVRRIRQDALNTAKRLVKESAATEDEETVFAKKIQEKVDATNKLIEELAKKKEEDVMKV